AARLDIGQLGQRLLDVPASLLQGPPPVVDLFQEVAQLADLARFGVVHVEDRGDLLQGEAESAPAQDQPETYPVPHAVDASLAVAARREEAAVLVDPDRPQCDAVLLGQLADRPGPRLFPLRMVPVWRVAVRRIRAVLLKGTRVLGFPLAHASSVAYLYVRV